jgi:hypothetical protein
MSRDKEGWDWKTTYPSLFTNADADADDVDRTRGNWGGQAKASTHPAGFNPITGRRTRETEKQQ